MVKIVGFQHKEGNFKSDDGRQVSYDNVVLYYISDCANNVAGCSVGEIKVPFAKCKEITGFDYGTLPEILDKEVDLFYIPVGKYQQLTSIRIVEFAKTVKN